MNQAASNKPKTMLESEALATIIAWTGEAGIAIRSLSGHYCGKPDRDASVHIHWLGEVLHYFGNYSQALISRSPEGVSEWAENALDAIEAIKRSQGGRGLGTPGPSLAFLADRYGLHLDGLLVPLRALAFHQELNE